MFKHLFGTLLIASVAVQVTPQRNGGAADKLRLVAIWQDLEYDFPSPTEQQNAVIQGKFVAQAGIPIDIDVDYRGRGQSKIFVTVPRFQKGVPITLGTLTGERRNGSPVLAAYPNYSWQNSHGRDCSGITSVFRVAIDECKRLWVLDTGRIADEQLCPPQLLVFDLRTDTLIHRYKFPAATYRSGISLFVTPVVEVRDPGVCQNTRVYIADVQAFGIVVYDMQSNRSWRAQNRLLFPHPTYGQFTIAGESFDLMDGVLGLALSPRDTNINQRSYGFFGSFFPSVNLVVPETNRVLYFHALASITENAVPTRALDNYTMWEANPEASPRSFAEIGTRGTQAAAEAMDKNGNLFFGMMDPIALACWDSRTDYNKQNIKIVIQNDETLQFMAGVKVVTNGNGEEELWILTNRFQKFMTGSMAYTEPNFRVFAVRIQDLLGGTRCSGRGTNNFVFPSYTG